MNLKVWKWWIKGACYKTDFDAEIHACSCSKAERGNEILFTSASRHFHVSHSFDFQLFLTLASRGETPPQHRLQRLPVETSVRDLAHYAKHRTCILYLQRVIWSGACLRFSAYVPHVCKLMNPDGPSKLHSLASGKHRLARAIFERTIWMPGWGGEETGGETLKANLECVAECIWACTWEV